MRRAMLKTPKIRCRTYLQLGIFELTREPSTKSAGLVVKGGDSYSEDCEFNPGAIYWMDIFTLICCLIVMFDGKCQT